MTRFARFTAPALVALALALVPHSGFAGGGLTLQEPVTIETLSKSKQTAPGLYITAADAGRVLADNPNVALIDVRTPSEVNLIGYATAAAANIPSKFVDPALAFDAKKGKYNVEVKFCTHSDGCEDNCNTKSKEINVKP